MLRGQRLCEPLVVRLISKAFSDARCIEDVITERSDQRFVVAQPRRLLGPVLI